MSEHQEHPHEEDQTYRDLPVRPVPVVLVEAHVDYKNTLRYISVMLTVIAIIGVMEGIERWF